MVAALMRRCSLFGLLVAGAVYAQTTAPVADPTRPPAALLEAEKPAAPAAASPPGEPGVSPFVLQSVMLPKRGAPVAIISGQYVPLGERYEGLVLHQVTESQVVLGEGEARRVLRLAPDVLKTERTATAKASATVTPHKPKYHRNTRTNTKKAVAAPACRPCVGINEKMSGDEAKP